ncbi:MAG: hypothetical protein ACM3O4_02615 [Ignavibacteriales bacterium]
MISLVAGFLGTLGLWAANGYSTACFVLFWDEEEMPEFMIK